MIAVAREEREKTANIQLDELETVRNLRKQGLITNSNVMAMERVHTNYRADLAQAELQQTQKQQDMMNLESELRRKRQTHDIELIAQIQDTQVELGKVQSQIRYMADKLCSSFHTANSEPSKICKAPCGSRSSGATRNRATTSWPARTRT